MKTQSLFFKKGNLVNKVDESYSDYQEIVDKCLKSKNYSIHVDLGVFFVKEGEEGDNVIKKIKVVAFAKIQATELYESSTYIEEIKSQKYVNVFFEHAPEDMSDIRLFRKIKGGVRRFYNECGELTATYRFEGQVLKVVSSEIKHEVMKKNMVTMHMVEMYKSWLFGNEKIYNSNLISIQKKYNGYEFVEPF